MSEFKKELIRVPMLVKKPFTENGRFDPYGYTTIHFSNKGNTLVTLDLYKTLLPGESFELVCYQFDNTKVGILSNEILIEFGDVNLVDVGAIKNRLEIVTLAPRITEYDLM